MMPADWGLHHGRIQPTACHQTGCGRIPIVANSSAAMAEAPASCRRAGDRRSNIGDHERSDDGKSQADRIFQPSSGGMTQSNEPPKNPGRFISTGDKGVERLCIRPATPHQKMTQRGHDMEIRVGSLVRDAREATDAAIIIDVFRAFTTAAIAFDHGAKDILITTQAKRNLSSRSGIGGVLSAT